MGATSLPCYSERKHRQAKCAKKNAVMKNRKMEKQEEKESLQEENAHCHTLGGEGVGGGSSEGEERLQFLFLHALRNFPAVRQEAGRHATGVQAGGMPPLHTCPTVPLPTMVLRERILSHQARWRRDDDGCLSGEPSQGDDPVLCVGCGVAMQCVCKQWEKEELWDR